MQQICQGAVAAGPQQLMAAGSTPTRSSCSSRHALQPNLRVAAAAGRPAGTTRSAKAGSAGTTRSPSCCKGRCCCHPAASLGCGSRCRRSSWQAAGTSPACSSSCCCSQSSSRASSWSCVPSPAASGCCSRRRPRSAARCTLQRLLLCCCWLLPCHHLLGHCKTRQLPCHACCPQLAGRCH